MQSQYSDVYPELWRRHWWWRSRQRIVCQTLKRHLATEPIEPIEPSTRRLLDIGCCGGVAFDDWSAFGEPYGIEPDPALVNAVPRWRSRIDQALFGGDFQFSDDFEADSEQRGTYDIVVMLDVLEHIEHDAAAAERVATLLEPGGLFVVTVPALPSLWSAHDEANRHFRRYTPATLNAVLQRAGLRVVEMEYLFAWSLPLVYARTWVARPGSSAYQVQVPNGIINSTFHRLTLWEETLRRRTGWRRPWGSSLLAVARHDDAVAPSPTEAMPATRPLERV